MKRLLPILLCSLLLSGLRNATAQEASKTWTLQECLDYAYQNNIQVRQSRNNQLSGIEDTKQAKAALFPSLVASTTQSYTNYPSSEVTDNNSYTGTYGITAGMTIFEGGKLRTEVKRQKVQNQMDALSVEESVNDIRIAIVSTAARPKPRRPSATGPKRCCARARSAAWISPSSKANIRATNTR